MEFDKCDIYRVMTVVFGASVGDFMGGVERLVGSHKYWTSVVFGLRKILQSSICSIIGVDCRRLVVSFEICCNLVCFQDLLSMPNFFLRVI